MSARNKHLYFDITRETQSSRALPKASYNQSSKERPQRSQHVISKTTSSNCTENEEVQASPQRKTTLVFCEHQECIRCRDGPSCQHYCTLHCCNFFPDHPGNIATRLARDEPKRFPSRRCRRIGCNSMRIRVCERYCRAHCCYLKHGNWKLGTPKESKPEPGASSSQEQHQKGMDGS